MASNANDKYKSMQSTSKNVQNELEELHSERSLLERENMKLKSQLSGSKLELEKLRVENRQNLLKSDNTFIKTQAEKQALQEIKSELEVQISALKADLAKNEEMIKAKKSASETPKRKYK